MAAGLALTVAAFVAACLSALDLPTPGRILAAAATLAALLAAIVWWRRPATPVQLRVTRDAEILARADPSSDARPLEVQFVASWLIVLGDRRSIVPVWADRLGASEFRRLAVACRWRRPPAAA
jgi:hypothetical protein